MAGSLQFRHRIGVLVAVAAIGLLTVTAVTLVLGRRSERQMSGIETRYVPLIELDRDLKSLFALIPRSLENAAAAAEDSAIKDADVATEQFRQKLLAGATTIADNGGDANALLDEFKTYYTTAREVSVALAGGAPADQLPAKIDAMRRQQQAFITHLDTAITPDHSRVAAAFSVARDSQHAALAIEIGTAAVAVVVMMLLSWQLIRRTVSSLQSVSSGMERLARGEFGEAIRVSSQDELGDLAREANRTAIRLRDYRQAGEREDWIKTGLGQLGDEVAGELDVATLGKKAMTYLAKYVAAEVGVAYVAGTAGSFHWLASYGTVGLGAAPSTFEGDDSILGQAVRDRDVRVLSNLPKDYLRIRSALGETAPRCVVIVPFEHEGKTRGVLELGLLEEPSDRALQLMRRARGPLGVAFHVAAQTAALEVQRSELARASRYKSEFLANMSHELRTPLNSIMILSKILADNDEHTLTAKQTEFATLIHKSGDELLMLINDVLDMAKVEAGKQELTCDLLPLTEMFDYVRRMFAPIAAQKQFVFEVELAADLPPAIRTDRTRLAQILKNLISNAFKFTEHGRVTVRVSRYVPGQLARLAGVELGDAIAIAVSDTGVGIAPDKQAWIFEAFAQAEGGTSRKYGGTGLGLTIARQLAVRLGGDLDVESALGAGSTFHVVLPVAGPPGDTAAMARTGVPIPIAPPATALAGTSTPPLASRAVAAPVIDDRAQLTRGEPCVLIVEDDPHFAQVVLEMVHQAGFKGLVSTEGRASLELAAAYVPSGIILDVGLPDLDGWAVMEGLKAQRVTREIPVHFITAADGAERARRMGAVGFTTKPVDAAQLRSALYALEQAARAGVRRVLLVENEAGARAAMQALLAGGDLEVDAAGSAREALALLATTAYGCVVASLGLPDHDAGLKLLASIRADSHTQALPVVIHGVGALDGARLGELEAQPHTLVVVDGERSDERVLAETRRFVDRVWTALPALPRTLTPVGPTREPLLAGKTVMIVDDDMRNVYSLSSALRAKQLRVVTAADGQEALDELARHPEIDVVLMDVMMPTMDGHEATRRIRAQAMHASLPIIALTAKTTAGDREKCLAAGASDYVPKPIDVDRLLALLRVWLS